MDEKLVLIKILKQNIHNCNCAVKFWILLESSVSCKLYNPFNLKFKLYRCHCRCWNFLCMLHLNKMDHRFTANIFVYHSLPARLSGILFYNWNIFVIFLLAHSKWGCTDLVPSGPIAQWVRWVFHAKFYVSLVSACLLRYYLKEIEDEKP